MSHAGRTHGTPLKISGHRLAFAEVILAATSASAPTAVPSITRRISASQLVLHASALPSFHHMADNVRRAQLNVVSASGPAVQLVSMRRAVHADDRVITSGSLDAEVMGGDGSYISRCEQKASRAAWNLTRSGLRRAFWKLRYGFAIQL